MQTVSNEGDLRIRIEKKKTKYTNSKKNAFLHPSFARVLVVYVILFQCNDGFRNCSIFNLILTIVHPYIVQLCIYRFSLFSKICSLSRFQCVSVPNKREEQ